MDSELSARANGVSPLPLNGPPRSGPGGLQARCRRQEVVIDRLSEAVVMMHRGTAALKAENAELRADASRVRNYRRFPLRAARPMEDHELVEVTLPLDEHAPRAARSAVTQCLQGRIAPSALDNAQLLVTELTSNSLRHSGTVDDVVVAVELTLDWFRVGVLDSGSDASIAVRPANTGSGGGFGLNLVQMLSERWGVEYPCRRGTYVWAQLRREP